MVQVMYWLSAECNELELKSSGLVIHIEVKIENMFYQKSTCTSCNMMTRDLPDIYA